MNSRRLAPLALAVLLTVAGCGGSGDKADPGGAAAPTAPRSTAEPTRSPATSAPATKEFAPPCSLLSRAKINRATRAAGLSWKEPRKAEVNACRYASVEGAYLSVLQFSGDQEARFKERRSCATTPVDLSPTAFVCDYGTKKPYAVLGYTLRAGRLWCVLITTSEKRGPESTAKRVIVARILAEIEGFDKKAVLKVLP